MLARSGRLPTGREWRFEPKLDGFRWLVCTHTGFRARSRRGWDMTELLPDLRMLPDGLQLDGELVAWGRGGCPDFHLLSRRMLHGERSIRATYMVMRSAVLPRRDHLPNLITLCTVATRKRDGLSCHDWVAASTTKERLARTAAAIRAAADSHGSRVARAEP